MLARNELRGAIAKNGYSQSRLAVALGMSPKTFYTKMEKGVFNSDEIYAMIKLLHIDDPMSIFFAEEVA